MNNILKFIPFTLVTAALFPVLAKADHFLYKALPVKLPLPSLILLLAILIPVIFKHVATKGEESFSKTYQNTILIALPFLMITLVSALWSLHPGANWEKGYRFLLMDLYHWVLLMISIAVAHSWVIRKHNHFIFLIILMGSCAAIWADIVFPGMFSVLESRAAGFAGNANWGGRIIIFLAIAAIQWKKNNLMNLVILTLSGLAVFATLSVGCLFLYLAILVTYLILKLREMKGEHIMMKAAMIPAVLILILFVVQPVVLNMMESSETFANKNSQERIDEILNMTKGDFTFATDHTRGELIDEYWEFISESPLIGKGTGFSLNQSYRPHNMYIKHWVENGLLGLLVYLTFNVCAFLHFFLLKDTRGMMFIFMFFMSGFFDHNLLQYKTFVVLVGILGTLAYLEKTQRPSLTKSEPRTRKLVSV